MTSSSLLGSVLIPAHDEQHVIGRCLDSLFDGLTPNEVEVAVVCNGCSDATAELARATRYDVAVIELDVASKSRALRAGEHALTAFPRIYLDADVVLPGGAARAVLTRLASDGALAARPPVHYDTSASSALVQAYYRARIRVPSLTTALWGAGAYGLSAAGRRRFTEYPEVVADDLFVDACFDEPEIEILPCDPVVVFAPTRIADLVRIMQRAYRGAEELEARAGGWRVERRTASRLRDLLAVCARDPRAIPDVGVYVAVAIWARLMTRLRSSRRWERDLSSREGVTVNP